jgi:hypothetical protein
MINYIRHDEEFYFVAKLVSGEQVIGKGFAVEEDSETSVYVSDPLEINIMIRSVNEKTVKGVGLNKWMHFSDEDFYVIREKDIVTIAGLSNELIAMYELFWQKERSEDGSLDEKQVELDPDMGHIGKVNDVRKKLEDLYKKS